MKLSMEYHSNGRTGLQIGPSSPYEVAAYPRELLLDMVVKRRPSDYLWVAAALAFGHRLAAEYNQAPAISPGVFSALTDYLGPEAVIGARVTEAAYGRGRIGNTLVLNLESDSLTPIAFADGSKPINVRMLDLGEWVGRLASLNQVVFATNASAFASTTGRQSIAPYIAVAVLIASDWSASRIVVPFSSPGALEASEQESMMALCSAIGIELEFFDYFQQEKDLLIHDQS